MPTIVDHDRSVNLLAEEWTAIADLFADFGDADYAAATCLPGWTVQDQLSHMVGTEKMLDGEPTPAVDVAHLAHLRNDIAHANEAWVESLRPLQGPEVLARFRSVTDKRLASLRAMTQADFDAPSWTPAGPDETYGRFMRIRHFDCFLHEHDVRGAVGAPDRDAAPHVRSALDEVATGLGYIVGRKAGLPEGSTVRIDVDGAVDDTWLVEVTDRARVVERLDGVPTAAISMPAMLFLRLTGGRQDPAPHLGTDITLSGDEGLARQLATHLAFTI